MRRDALLVRVADPAALADALTKILSDPALAARLRSGGHAVVQRFAWAAAAAEHVRCHAGLAAPRQGR